MENIKEIKQDDEEIESIDEQQSDATIVSSVIASSF
jgi:hypothetical protein